MFQTMLWTSSSSQIASFPTQLFGTFVGTESWAMGWEGGYISNYCLNRVRVSCAHWILDTPVIVLHE